MPKRIYIETTIPSSYYTLRTDEESLVRQEKTRQWWDEYADIFTLTSSTAVVEELEQGSRQATLDRLALLEGIEMFKTTERADCTDLY